MGGGIVPLRLLINEVRTNKQGLVFHEGRRGKNLGCMYKLVMTRSVRLSVGCLVRRAVRLSVIIS